MTLSHGSAFSGIGGAEVAAEFAGGYEHAWMIEFAPYQHALLERRYPGVRVEWDVRTAGVPGVDVLTAGFPCQPFSVAGRRAGADDARNMWPATGQLIRRTRPRVALLENVPGLRNPHGSEPAYFGVVLADLAALGYDAAWDCVPASRVGAPHRRDRLWIVAWDTRRVEPFDPFTYYREAGAAPVGGMWATPTAQQPGGTAERFLERKQEARARGASLGVALTDLQMQARDAMWATPRTSDTNGPGEHGTGGLDLRTSVHAVMWPTPRKSWNENRTTKPAPSHGAGHGRVFAGEVHAAMWPTPSSEDNRDRGGDVPNTSRRIESGKQVNLGMAAGLATHSRSGTLNPEWVELLMGYPHGWTDLAVEPVDAALCAWPGSDLRVGDVAGTNPDYARHWLGPAWGPWPLAPRTKATKPRLSGLGNAWVPQVAAPILAAIREALS